VSLQEHSFQSASIQDMAITTEFLMSGGAEFMCISHCDRACSISLKILSTPGWQQEAESDLSTTKLKNFLNFLFIDQLDLWPACIILCVFSIRFIY
jgi:hypothetical protein